jgi:Domain of unknown function (DUF4365)
MARKTKLSPDSQLIAQQAINLGEEITLDMGFLWHPPGVFDHGIDGRIELRDARAKQPLNRYLGVQSKARAKFTAETDDRFEFLCEEADIDYWMRAEEPVLLVCSHPSLREAWFVCVTDWFIDPERRASRRIVFDKRSDRFTADRAVELLRLGTRSEPVLHRRPPTPPERLLTNLMPILEHGSWLWSAPTDAFDHRQVRARYDEAGGPRASDYLLRDGLLYSLRDPRTCALRHVCDTTKVTQQPVGMWSEAQDPRLRRYWVELLRRNLLQQIKHRFGWNRERSLFYVRPPEPLAERSVEGPNGKRLGVKVEHYIDKRDGERRVAYVRHQAFRPGFVVVDGRWHLEIVPDYLFTFDGEHVSRRADEKLAGIKMREKNLAVLGHMRMWEHLLTRPPSLLSDEPPLLLFGPLLTIDVPVGIDDALWRGKVSDDGVTGQEELAA